MIVTSQGFDGLYRLMRREKQGEKALEVSAKLGDCVECFGKKDSGTLQGGRAPHKPSSTGRIFVKVVSAQLEVFPSVYDLFW